MRWLLFAAPWLCACSPGPELSILITAAPTEEVTADEPLGTNLAVALRGHESTALRAPRASVPETVGPDAPYRLAVSVQTVGQYAVHVDLWKGDQVWAATHCLSVDGVERIRMDLVRGATQVDADADGWPAEGPTECAPFAGGLADCDDAAPLVHPFAIDVCNSGIDEDCAGGDAECSDLDGDGWGDQDDCDDENPDVHPGAIEDCDAELDTNCDGEPRCDADGDGFLPGPGEDCDDTDPDVHPGAAESCVDDVDSDCDGFPSNGCLQDDQDGDGVSAVQAGGEDCGDCDPSVHPGAPEVCGDGIDQDCSGADLPCTAGDQDHDGVVGVDAGGTDCDDADPNVHPGAPEACGSAEDVDCDGRAGGCDSPDGDGDGWEELDDCDDANPDIHPGATEVCNDVDDDCDGIVDEPDNCISMSSEQNCGGCWVQCQGSCATGTCRCGEGPGCAADQHCCDGTCANLLTAERNCGACGISCHGSEECLGGACECGDGGVACAAGFQCCDGVCADLQSDPDHCGSCDNNCGRDTQCRTGRCLCPGVDQPVDLQTDNDHCGRCETRCDTRCNGSHPCERCIEGQCQSQQDGDWQG